jgi:hypothetical protein
MVALQNIFYDVEIDGKELVLLPSSIIPLYKEWQQKVIKLRKRKRKKIKTLLSFKITLDNVELYREEVKLE